MFAEHAYDDISTDDIAALAGISKGLLYHYFRGKKHFYVEVIRAAGQDLVAAMAPSPDAAPDTAMASSLIGFLSFVQSNQLLYRAVLRGGLGSDREVFDVAEQVRREAMAHVADGLGLAVEDPAIRARLYGWVGLAECLSLDWIETAHLSLPELLGILGSALANLLDPVAPEQAAIARRATALVEVAGES